MERRRSYSSPVAWILLVVCTTGPSWAGDWPMWRYGALRGGAAPDALPTNLKLAWTRQLPPANPAWPVTQPRLRFDVAPHPVAAGERIFVPSTVTDSVTAYDTHSGRQLWRRVADGPVRFAPVVNQGRVYFVSDDGHLYCVDANTGDLKWKVSGGPTDRRILGNSRLISTWPARGGPVLHQGRIYFTASIWPFMGIFVHAVDPESGQIIWTNSGDGTNWTIQPHGAPSFATVSPQGHLAASGDYLIVPGGRSVPAVFDTNDGQLLHFRYSGKHGGHEVWATDTSYFVGGNGYALSSGGNVALPQPTFIAGDRQVLASSDSVRLLQSVSAEQAPRQKLLRDRRGQLLEADRKHLLEQSVVRLARPVSAGWLLQAGPILVGMESPQQLVAYQLPENSDPQTPLQPVWSHPIEGQVWSALAADDRLFVVTLDGKLSCFAPERESEKPTHHPLSEKSLASSEDAAALLATKLLAEPSSRQGYGVVLGLQDGRLVEELLQRSDLMLIAVDPQAERVTALRKRLIAAGLYGRRVSVHQGDLSTFSLPPYLANVLTSERPETAAGWIAHASGSLRPYGGRIVLATTKQQHAGLSKQIENPTTFEKQGGQHPSSQQPDASALVLRRTPTGLTVIVREGPLPGSDSWTHQYGNPAQTGISQETLVKVPLGILWFGGPSHEGILPRHGHGPTPQVAGGRVVIEGPDKLRALDAYTGRLLWETQFPGLGTFYDSTAHQAGAGEIGSNYVTLSDAIYVVYGDRIVELDPETGEPRRELQAPSQGDTSLLFGFAAVDGDTLFAAAAPLAVNPSRQGSSIRKPVLPQGAWKVIKEHANWRYLAGSDAPKNWESIGFDDSQWPSGPTSIGYGDGDDKTLLNMRGKFVRVYIRHRFEGKNLQGIKKLALVLNYDDAFIAYLNGQEVARGGVGSGRGPDAQGIASHEARGAEYFEIKDFAKLLRAGKNVLCIEGHNRSINSSDFTLDPFLVALGGQAAQKAPSSVLVQGQPKQPDSKQPGSKQPGSKQPGSKQPGSKQPGSKQPGSEKSQVPAAFREILSQREAYASGSRFLIAFDRRTGRKLWQREAQFNFRHNNIALGASKVFCIDALSEAKKATLRRRGIELPGQPTLYALDARSGEVVWQTHQPVFGTFLNYSAAHDLLIQGGSAYRDRARDEVGQGLAAFQGSDGQLVWHKPTFSYGGPCLLWRDSIVTNGAGGQALDIRTGEPTGWSYRRNYGCNTAVGCQNLLTFRSGAAGFFDLASDSGTGNLGGFRSSCTNNLIPADGLLNAPDYTRTCNCAYQNQTSLALIHLPQAEFWAFGAVSAGKRLGINFAAPGDRRDAQGTLWVDVPSVGGPSPQAEVKLFPQEGWQVFRQHSSRVQEGSLPWVAASGLEGIQQIQLPAREGQRYQLRLIFLEPREQMQGRRVFDVFVQGHMRLRGLDVHQQAGGPWRALTKRLQVSGSKDGITIEFKPQGSEQAVISGIELVPAKATNPDESETSAQ